MLQVYHWENHLLDLAHQAMDSGVSATSLHDQQRLQSAYASCEAITRENSKTFFLASGLMPEDKRRATRALYAFCRVSDDIVDKPVNTNAESNHSRTLDQWQKYVINPYHEEWNDDTDREVILAWSDARRNFCIPNGYVEQFIDGLALDLNRVRYRNFSELSHYCYRVACTVGLMSMHITGYESRAAIPFAIRLGVALQLTNILRDVGEDWRAGRLYLPLEELHGFGLSEEDVALGVIDDRWRSFMRFQIARTRRLYKEALPGVSLLHPDGRFAIAAAGELYQAILRQIEAHDYNVFEHRASVGGWGKLSRLPGIWWRANCAHYAA
jgi:15-cis-phytoene synthase